MPYFRVLMYPRGVGKLLLLFVQGNIKDKKKMGLNAPKSLISSYFRSINTSVSTWNEPFILMSGVYFCIFSYKEIRQHRILAFARSREYVHYSRLSGRFGYIPFYGTSKSARLNVLSVFLSFLVQGNTFTLYFTFCSLKGICPKNYLYFIRFRKQV